MADLFDAAGMYDEDYLRFFATPGDGTEPGEAAADLTWRLLDLRPGVRVLDLACGHGEPARHLAARGCRGAAFVKRLFGYPELRDWLLAAGFATVSGYGEDRRPLAADHRRMIAVAVLSS
jgi:SAM-dependent methyltransferase